MSRRRHEVNFALFIQFERDHIVGEREVASKAKSKNGKTQQTRVTEDRRKTTHSEDRLLRLMALRDYCRTTRSVAKAGFTAI